MFVPENVFRVNQIMFLKEHNNDSKWFGVTLIHLIFIFRNQNKCGNKKYFYENFVYFIIVTHFMVNFIMNVL